MYCWNIFSTLLFAQECLKRFGNENDKFVLIYRDKTEQEKNQAINEAMVVEEEKKSAEGCKNPYSKILLESKNIIFRGAPGTGKSYLAKEIAADIISNGYTNKYTDLSEEQKRQVEFVQFHPSYDYSDFVEGLRPKMNNDGSMGFELRDGVFKRFADRARKNLEDSKKSKELVRQEVSAKTAVTDFFGSINLGVDTFKTVTGNEFTIVNVDDKHVSISIPGNATIDKLNLNIEELQKMLESDVVFEKVNDITNFFGKQFATQAYSYDFAIYKAIKLRKTEKHAMAVSPEAQKNMFSLLMKLIEEKYQKYWVNCFLLLIQDIEEKSGRL